MHTTNKKYLLIEGLTELERVHKSDASTFQIDSNVIQMDYI